MTLTASPSGGHIFDGWSGDCAGTGTCSLTLDANRAAAAAFTAPAGVEASVGRWDAPEFNPVIGMHLSQLLNGKYLLWGHTGEPQLWDPAGGFTQVTDATCTNPQICELFCAGHAFLPDGSVLVAGGHNEALGYDNGITQASIFDGFGWRATGSMRYPRWYPTLVTMFDGRVIALSGDQAPGSSCHHSRALRRRRLDPAHHGRAEAAAVPARVRRAQERPNFHCRARQPIAVSEPLGHRQLDRRTEPVGRRAGLRGGGDAGQHRGVLRRWRRDQLPGEPPTRTGERIDLGATTPVWQAIAPMAIGRRQLNAVILADGTVLVTGGSSQCGFTNEAGAVFAAERWDPSGGSNGQGVWTTMANASVVRVYHSTAVLMPDGRVLSSGSGDGADRTPQNTYEIYSPPYLFQGTRPTYTLSSNAIHYAGTFTVTTPDAAAIRNMHIIRLASTTHAFDVGQRLRSLTYQVAADGQSLTVTAPLNGKSAPPGPYMLFLVNLAGVPSVGKVVLLDE